LRSVRSGRCSTELLAHRLEHLIKLLSARTSIRARGVGAQRRLSVSQIAEFANFAN
jgi:hypothetical protein